MPQNSLYHRRFGNLLINYPEKNSEAQQHLELAIQLNRMDASAYNDLGYLFIQQERWTEARVQLETGLGIDPSQAALYKNLGQVDLYDRRLTEAIEHLETSIKIDKTGVGTDAWFWLAQAYAAQNNVSLACEILYDMQKFFHPEGRTEDMLKQLDCSQSER
jgi:tetratricopeptide (TPR) repeat protein